MKVALLIYGHLRTYRQCFSSLKRNLLDRYSPDIFIHTWDENEAATKTWHNNSMTREKIDIEHMIKLYKPISYKIGHQDSIEDDKVTGNRISIKGQQYMLSGINQVNRLKKEHEARNGFKYDMAIKIRPDILLKNPLNLENIDSSFLHIAGNSKTGEYSDNINDYKACDIINVGSSQKLDIVSGAIDEFDRYFLGTPKHSGFIDYLSGKSEAIRPLNYLFYRDWEILRASK